MWTGFFSKSGHSDNSIRGNQVKVSLHLFLLQVWVRLTDIPGLCWISWRFSVHSVDAGHWYRRVPATAPHRRKRREFQSVNPTSVSLGSVASSNLSPVNSSQNELWSTHVVRIHHPFYCLPLTDAKLAAMCSLVSCDLWRSVVRKSVREIQTLWLRNFALLNKLLLKETFQFSTTEKYETLQESQYSASSCSSSLNSVACLFGTLPGKKMFVLPIPVGFCLEFSLWRPPLGYDVFWPSHFAFVALMNLLLWERQILHFHYGQLYIWKTCRTCCNNLLSFTKERGET